MVRRPAATPREPLPVDAASLPPLGQDARRVLKDGLSQMSLDLSPPVLAAMDDHARLLAAWGRHVNLTAIREPVEIARLHVLDSLTAVSPIRTRVESIHSIVDIGSGGGYPGIPLGLALGAARISVVESVGRKARFLEVAGAAADRAVGGGGHVVEVLPVRAEALAAGARRATWDVAVVRAVGDVAECAELGLPLLRTGGLLVCWKRERVIQPGSGGASTERTEPGLRREVDAARSLIAQLGGATPEVVPVELPDLPGHVLVLVRKQRATPPRFPRSPAARGSPRRAC